MMNQRKSQCPTFRLIAKGTCSWGCETVNLRINLCAACSSISFGTGFVTRQGDKWSAASPSMYIVHPLLYPASQNICTTISRGYQ